MPGSVIFDNVSKAFGDTNAVDHVSLEIKSGQFFSILGPSGCGKTTLLRLVAGFERPDFGRIFIDDQEIQRHGGKAVAFLHSPTVQGISHRPDRSA